MDQTKKHDIAELERLYTDSENCDAEIFSEMRSNLLLISGEHYNKRQSSYFRRIRDSKDLSEQQKLRLTKNHIQKITKTYANNIISLAPGVGITPKNESELQDQKSAELHHAVWQDAVEKHNVDELVDDWADDFVGVGEVGTKIFFDESLGPIIGHKQATDEDGNLQYDEAGAPVRGEAVHKGDFVFEEFQGFNLLRAPEAKTLDKSPYLTIRKMVNKNDLIEKFSDNKKFIQESSDSTMVVFDSIKGGYRKSKDEVLLKETYFRPCHQYPNGYYYFFTKEGILAEGELPGGIFPIITQPFERIQTTPRGRSPVKVMRPYQAEINRSASKMAEHQITLGDDKVLIQNGTSIAQGVALPGVRSINYTGIEPKILSGRDGSQYLNYMNAQITELYEVMNISENAEEATGQVDPYTLLFRSASQKKKFKRYIKRFERFLIKVTKTYLRLAKHHLSPDDVVLLVGRNERANIAEFKTSSDLCYEIKVTPQSDDVESKLGKQLVLNHILQYTGNKLDKQDIGKLIRLSPYVNVEEGLSDLTADYDSATDNILALDRGELPPISPYDEHTYMIKRLVKRVRQGDFKFLPPEVQQNYTQMIALHQMAETERLRKLQMAQAGFIPTGGYLVVCDLYVPDPTNPAKTRRARIPYESLTWLIKKLEAQGQSQDELEKMNQGAVEQMAQLLINKQDLQSNGMDAGQNMGAEPPVGELQNVV